MPTNNTSTNKTSSPDANLSICGIILCAGVGNRTGLGYNKLLHYVGRKTILEHTLDRFADSRVQSTVLVANPQDYDTIVSLSAPYKNILLTLGGNSRAESVRCGLKQIGSCDIVVIHDGARPYVLPELIDKTITSAVQYGSGILAVPSVDSIKEIKNEVIVRTLIRNGLYNIQTPQTFNFNHICHAYRKVDTDCNDDSEVYALAGYSPRIVLGDYNNIKLTSQSDFLRPATIQSKVGVGFDVHRLVEGKPFILGGVHIPFYKGLEGHSDADVLTHAIMDALLSAAGLPDIGVMFPNTDPTLSGADSMELLTQVLKVIQLRGFSIVNISAVVMAEKPKLAHLIPDICASIANRLMLPLDAINVSATTTEGLGIVGEGNGIASSASCLLCR